MNPFKGKIKCGYCNSSYRKKTERGVAKYLCSQYGLNSRTCRRIIVREEMLIGLLELRYKIVDDELIRNKVNLIIVTDERITIDIFEEEPIVLTDKFGKF